MADLTSTTVSTNVLKCPIILENGSKITYNIQNPLPNLTKSELESSSNNKGFIGYMINESLINKNGYQATTSEDPYYYTTEKIYFD